MTFPSAHHSPRTVNKNAKELVIGTIRLNSTRKSAYSVSPFLFPNPDSTMPRNQNSPAFPINKKNHTLPVKLINSGTAYPGLRSKSKTVYTAFSTFLFTQLSCSESTAGRDGGWKFTAARRMKGVVRPQAMPTRRNPSVQRKMEGEGGERESPASIARFETGGVRETRSTADDGVGWWLGLVAR